MNRPSSDGSDCDPQAAADFLRALAHPMRLRILCRLIDGEVAVAEFESVLGLKQPSLSQQLAQLREAGLVATRREAKSVFYSLADSRVGIVLDALRSAFPSGARAEGARPPKPASRPHTRMATVPRGRPKAARAAGECGVFSIAGWPAGAAR